MKKIYLDSLVESLLKEPIEKQNQKISEIDIWNLLSDNKI